jgi:DNA repair protein RecN (Recombination protein N)
MLTELSIENFAIIDSLRVHFESGLTVMTGETGAGKSILIDALQVAMGARAGAEVVRDGAPGGAVEAVFELPESERQEALDALLDEYGLDAAECLILRREVNAGGRSSGRVNGRAVPMSVLSVFGSLLVDIHGQSDHLSILRRDRQLDVLDRYGGLASLRSRVANALDEYDRVRSQLQELTEGQREARQRLDLLRFQVQEIEGTQLQVGEEEDLEAERNRLVNAERLTQLSAAAFEALHGEAGGGLEVIQASAASAQELAAIDPGVAELAQRLQAVQYEVEDVAQELRRYRDGVEYDPHRLDAIEERIDSLSRLKRKYGATVPEVISFGERARAEMENVENLDERIAALERQVGEAERRAGELAGELTVARRKTAKTLGEAIHEALQGLGLKGSQFEIELVQTPSPQGLALPHDGARYTFTRSGVDNVAFLVSFNPGESVRSIDKVASGGETSRFLLALKSVLAAADETPTLVFDEVDVGVGARAGMSVGERLRELSSTHQVISISHLPQIAALADHHLTVTKKALDGRVSVSVRSLETPDRIVEIAAMMSGTGTEAARRNAEELLEAAQRTR